MIGLRIGWSVLWLSVVGAFAYSYWRLERTRDAQWREHFTRWGQWTQWRDKRIAEEFSS